MHGQHHPGAGGLTQPGQDAFGAIAEVVRTLEADPGTDWSKVDLERLRQHLIDMNEVVLRAAVKTSPVPGGLTMDITGSGRTAQSIRAMIVPHAAELDRMPAWSAKTEPLPDGVRLIVVARDPSDASTVAKIRGLGFAGLLVQGGHHGPHHLAMAKGELPHRPHALSDLWTAARPVGMVGRFMGAKVLRSIGPPQGRPALSPRRGPLRRRHQAARACSTRRSCAAPTRTPASRPIRTDAARRLPGVAHVFTFADLERWMKPLPLFGADTAGPGRARGRDDEAGAASSPCAGTRCATWARSWPWCWRRAARSPRTAASWSRSSTSRCPWWPTWSRRAEPGRARALPGVGRQHRRSSSRPASATPTPRSPAPTSRVRERFDDPALRRHADRDARGGRPVGCARRLAHHVERHAGGPLRPAGAGGRARAAAAQDPRHRARRGRRLRHQGQRLRGGPADPRRGHRCRAGR